MNEAAMEGPVLYAEPGSSWWPVLWGPVFVLLGLGVEVISPGPVHVVVWLLTGVALAAAAAVWVYGRRRVVAVRLTPAGLTQGRETLEIRRIVAVTEVGAPVGARVLGGSWTVPKGTGEVPLRLDDERVVLAWARDPAALTDALAGLVEKGRPDRGLPDVGPDGQS